MNSAENIHFGPFRLDSDHACVWRETQRLTLSAKAFAILCYLLEHRDRLVTKKELLQTLWPETVVGDAVLKVHVSEIRRVLGDNVRTPQFVETVHRRGYRFIGPVASSQHSVVSSPSASLAPSTQHPAPALVGRAEELQRLHNLLAEAQAGERQFLFIAGEAGIGKTTLVETFLSQVGASMDAYIIAGQCVEQYGIGEAYRPFLEAFGRLCRDPKQGTLLPLLSRYAPTWIMQIPSLLTADDLLRIQREVLGATSERMLREMAEAVEALTAEHTCILVIEDLHWSDYATLDLLAALARRHEPARLLVIGTYRPVDTIVSGHPLKAVRQELQIHGQCQELALELLSEDEVAEYLSRRFVMAVPDQHAALAQMIYRRTDGNPLFIVNVVSDVMSQGFLSERNGRWELRAEIETVGNTVPENVRHMIDRQVERLSDREQRLLEAGSVVGMEFSIAVIAAALEDDAQEIARCCESLARQGQFLRSTDLSEWPDGTMVERYQFVHALHQNILYQRIALGRRVYLARRIGERLERAYGERAAEIAPELAVHFEQGRDYERAIRYLRQAATNDFQRYANREAIGHLSRALKLVERLPMQEQRVRLHLEILHQLGLAYRVAGDLPEAAKSFAALEAFAQVNNQIEWEVKALLHSATTLSWLDHERCLATAEQAIKLSHQLGNGELHIHARAYHSYWRSLAHGWRGEDVQVCVQAMELARQAEDRDLLGLHLGRVLYFQCVQAQYRLVCHTAEEEMRVALKDSDAHSYMTCQFFRAWALLHVGEWSEMVAALKDGEQMANRNQAPAWQMAFRLEKAWLCEQVGDWAQARELSEYGLVQAQEIKNKYGEFLGGTLLGQVYLGMENYERAIHYFSTVSDRPKGVLMDWISRMPLSLGLSEYWLAQKEYERARHEAEQLCALAVQPGERTYLALGHRMLAEIALTQRKWEEAEQEVTLALSVHDGVEAPLAEWRVHATAAQIAEQRRCKTQARTHWERSKAVVLRLADSLDEASTMRQSFLTHRTVRSILQRS